MPISESACGLRNSMHHRGNAGSEERKLFSLLLSPFPVYVIVFFVEPGLDETDRAAGLLDRFRGREV